MNKLVHIDENDWRNEHFYTQAKEMFNALLLMFKALPNNNMRSMEHIVQGRAYVQHAAREFVRAYEILRKEEMNR